MLPRREHVPQKRLIQPRHSNGGGSIVDDRVEDLEPRTTRRAQPAAENPSGERRRPSWLQRRNRLQPAAILVAKRKSIQQILDGQQTGVREVGGASWAHALQILK